MVVIEKAKKILEQHVCDHCLGRQFAQLGTGYTNNERGRIIRSMTERNIPEKKMDENNLRGFKFPKFKFPELKKTVPVRCSVCNNFFTNMQKWVDRIKKASKNVGFETFLVGTTLSDDLIEREEGLWERVGIDYCEPIKSEINRELGKLVEKRLKKRFDKNPDVCFVLDIANNRVTVRINPLMFYGEYQKLIRGVPQTKWPSGKYKSSVEQIMAKPYLSRTKGTGTKLHGAGREDIDARCLGWRPFVLEILEPKKRLTLKEIRSLAKKIPKNKIRIRNLHLSNHKEVAHLKAMRLEKTYVAIVLCKNIISKNDLKKLAKLSAVVLEQKTPERVLHRRADLLRKRKIFMIKTKYINKKSFRIEIRAEAGTYVKEFITGDNGRTKPNISDALNNACACKELDVIKIHI